MIPVLEVGGTHVSAALVSPADWTVSAVTRHDLDAAGCAEDILAGWARTASALVPSVTGPWGVAMPDPFDYRSGVALFDASVGKFGALHGVDVGARLRAALGADVVFVNDADAFALGESTLAPGSRRLVGLTLGTGVGSGWVADGVVVDPGRPAGGRIHTATVDGRPLEDLFSRRAIRRAFAAAGGPPAADVREICELARTGDARASTVLRDAVNALGAAVGPAVTDFRADVLVVGGSMAASWDLFEPWFAAAGGPGLPVVRVSLDAERGGLVGAAAHAVTDSHS